MPKYPKVNVFMYLMIVLCLSCIPLLVHEQVLIRRDSFKTEMGMQDNFKRITNKNTRRNRNIVAFYDDPSPEENRSDNQAILSEKRSFLFGGYRYILRNSKRNAKTKNTITLNDIFISVKTSLKFHGSRLKLIIDTWFQTAKNQTFFYTDSYDKIYDKLTGGHLINTGCKDSHTRYDLSCKMGAEYDGYVASNKKWWCHFDDDNYVNVKQLVSLLRLHKWEEDVYLGKPSLDHPFYVNYEDKRVEFWFGTGGAGVCISRSLAEKMKPWCGNGELVRTSNALRVPDDCTLGYVISNRLGVNLTKSDLLHSHLECLSDIDHTSMQNQVSLSYRLTPGLEKDNTIHIPTKKKFEDKTNFLALHCMLHPNTVYCDS